MFGNEAFAAMKGEVIDPKDLKACAKLLKQTKKESKVLEGLAILSKAQPHQIATFMEEGAVMVPLTSLIDLAKLSERVVQESLAILAVYLNLEDHDGPIKFIAEGQTKKSSPCRGIERFLKVLQQENQKITTESLKCLAGLSKALNTLEDGAELLQSITEHCITLLEGEETPEEACMRTIRTLLAVLNAGSPVETIVNAVLKVCVDESTPVKIQDAASQMLYEATALPECTNFIIESPERPTQISTLFQNSIHRLVGYTPAKGEAPDLTEKNLKLAETGARSALLLFLWILVSWKQPPPMLEKGSDESELLQSWVLDESCYDSLLSLLKSKRSIVDEVLACLPQLPEQHIKALADRNAADILLHLLNERNDPQILNQSKEDIDSPDDDVEEEKENSDAEHEHEHEHDKIIKEIQNSNLEPKHKMPRHPPLPLEYALHMMLSHMEAPACKIEDLKTVISRAPTQAMRLLMRLIHEKKAKLHDMEEFKTWIDGLVKGGVFHTLAQQIHSFTVKEAQARAMKILLHLVRWNSQGPSQTALKDPIKWMDLWGACLHACASHSENPTLTACHLVDPLRRPPLRPLQDIEMRWPSKAVETMPGESDVPDDIAACALQLLTTSIEADNEELALHDAEEGKNAPSRFFDRILLSADICLGKFVVESLIASAKTSTIMVQQASLDALRALCSISNGRETVLAQNLSTSEDETHTDNTVDSDKEEEVVTFMSHAQGSKFEVMQRISKTLSQILYDHEQSDQAIQYTIAVLQELCKDQCEEGHEHDQPIDADLFCVAVLQEAILPALVAIVSYEPLQGNIVDYVKYVVLRGECRERAWRTWQEPELNEEGNAILDEEGHPVLVTKGLGDDPNHGPDCKSWAPLLDIPCRSLKSHKRMTHLPELSDQTAVALLVRQPETDVLVNLLDAFIRVGADLEQAAPHDGVTPLMWASVKANERCTRNLLESNRVDIDAIDVDGFNVCAWGFAGAKLVPMLLEFGADVNISEAQSGTYPLHWLSVGMSRGGYSSSPSDYSGWLDDLVKHGAELDLTDLQGRTALHVAISKGQALVSFDLLDQGADPNIIDAEGNLALHLACKGAGAGIIQALLDKGNKKPLKEGVYNDHGRGKPLADRIAFRVDQALESGLRELLQPKIISDLRTKPQELMQVYNKAGWSPFNVLLSGSLSPASSSLPSIYSAGEPVQQDAIAAWQGRSGALAALLDYPSLDVGSLITEHRGTGNVNSFECFFQHQIPDEVSGFACSMLGYLLQYSGIGSAQGLVASDDHGLSALHYACIHLPTEIVVTEVLKVLGDMGSWEVTGEIAVDPLTLLTPWRDVNDTSRMLFSWLLDFGQRFSDIVSSQNFRSDIPDHLTGTPLTVAAELGDIETVQLLLENNNIYLDAKEMATGRTALHMACEQGHTDIAIQLAVDGADMEITDSVRNEAPIFFVVRGGHVDSLVRLVGNTEEPGILYGQLQFVNADGDSPLLMAEELSMHADQGSRYDDLVQFLLRATTRDDEDVAANPVPASTDPVWRPVKYLSEENGEEARLEVFPGQHRHPCFSRGIAYSKWQVAVEKADEADRVLKEKEEAATRIQALHRGRTLRIKGVTGPSNDSDESGKKKKKKKGDDDEKKKKKKSKKK